jgi:hypothetical protein
MNDFAAIEHLKTNTQQDSIDNNIEDDDDEVIYIDESTKMKENNLKLREHKLEERERMLNNTLRMLFGAAQNGQTPPSREQMQLQTPPSREQMQLQTLPSREQMQLQTLPSREHLQLQTRPSQEQMQLQTTPSQEQLQLQTPPSREHLQLQTLPSREQMQLQTLPMQEHVQLNPGSLQPNRLSNLSWDDIANNINENVNYVSNNMSELALKQGLDYLLPGLGSVSVPVAKLAGKGVKKGAEIGAHYGKEAIKGSANLAKEGFKYGIDTIYNAGRDEEYRGPMDAKKQFYAADYLSEDKQVIEACKCTKCEKNYTYVGGEHTCFLNNNATLDYLHKNNKPCLVENKDMNKPPVEVPLRTVQADWITPFSERRYWRDCDIFNKPNEEHADLSKRVYKKQKGIVQPWEVVKHAPLYLGAYGAYDHIVQGGAKRKELWEAWRPSTQAEIDKLKAESGIGNTLGTETEKPMLAKLIANNKVKVYPSLNEAKKDILKLNHNSCFIVENKTRLDFYPYKGLTSNEWEIMMSNEDPKNTTQYKEIKKKAKKIYKANLLGVLHVPVQSFNIGSQMKNLYRFPVPMSIEHDYNFAKYTLPEEEGLTWVERTLGIAAITASFTLAAALGGAGITVLPALATMTKTSVAVGSLWTIGSTIVFPPDEKEQQNNQVEEHNLMAVDLDECGLGDISNDTQFIVHEINIIKDNQFSGAVREALKGVWNTVMSVGDAIEKTANLGQYIIKNFGECGASCVNRQLGFFESQFYARKQEDASDYNLDIMFSVDSNDRNAMRKSELLCNKTFYVEFDMCQVPNFIYKQAEEAKNDGSVTKIWNSFINTLDEWWNGKKTLQDKIKEENEKNKNKQKPIDFDKLLDRYAAIIHFTAFSDDKKEMLCPHVDKNDWLD